MASKYLFPQSKPIALNSEGTSALSALRADLAHSLQIVDALLESLVQPQSATPPDLSWAFPNSKHLPAQKASTKQKNMLFAIAQQNKLSKQELNSVLLNFGVATGFTGDILAKDVNAVKTKLEQLGAEKQASATEV